MEAKHYVDLWVISAPELWMHTDSEWNGMTMLLHLRTIFTGRLVDLADSSQLLLGMWVYLLQWHLNSAP